MLHPLDDQPIHQTPEPLLHPATGDRNAYDRFFFNGYTRDGSLYFAAAFGLYPNRGIRDAAFSVVRDGVQHALHASREAAPGGALRVGPITIEFEEPMRALRLRVAPNEWGLAADLLFTARTAAVEEPRFVRREQGRLFMDYTRFTQFGAWDGWLEAAGARIPAARADVLGSRDRSWGIRPVGERPPGPLLGVPQFYWLWAPLHFEDCCTHFDVNEDASGARWHAFGAQVPLLAPGADPCDPAGLAVARSVAQRITWQPGTRRAARAEIDLIGADGGCRTLALDPILHFQMRGIGYTHPEWGHGIWKGPEAVAGESWKLADGDPLDFRQVHVQTLCRARLGERQGVGILEQFVIGPHAPSGFTSLLDGAR
jgi:hypothetical protein